MCNMDILYDLSLSFIITGIHCISPLPYRLLQAVPKEIPRNRFGMHLTDKEGETIINCRTDMKI